MKKLSILTLALLLFMSSVQAQNAFPATGSAGIGTTTPNSSSLLEMISTSKGLLIPRMTKNQRDAIISPATGLLIYQTNGSPSFYFYDGSTWKQVATGSGGANKTLSNLTSPVAINQHLLPASNNSIDLGSSTLNYKDMHLSGKIFVNGIPYFKTNAGNLYWGYESGYSDAVGSGENTAYGYRSLWGNTTGRYNTAIGLEAMYGGALGPVYGNTAVGYGSLHSVSSPGGGGNTAIGQVSLYHTTTGYWNTGVGNYALTSNTTGTSNVAVGTDALYSSVQNSNNVAIGDSALYKYNDASFKDYMLAAGTKALYNNTNGYYNTALGGEAMYNNTFGVRNTAVGVQALNTNTSGSDNTALGYLADVSTAGLTNATALGSKAKVNASNKVVVGNTSVTVIGGEVGWSILSDGRFKKNIKKDVPGLAFINKLEAVTYNIDVDKYEKHIGQNTNNDMRNREDKTAKEKALKKIHTGFVAQDVEKVAAEINYDFDGINAPVNEQDNYSIVYAGFVPSIVKSIQELSKQNEELKAELAEMKAQLQKIQSNTEKVIRADETENKNLLQQNAPNPFSESAIINYTIPAKTVSAKIILTNQDGKVIKEFPISGTGKGSVNVSAAGLSAGIYHYTLYIDNKMMGSKKMEITR